MRKKIVSMVLCIVMIASLGSFADALDAEATEATVYRNTRIIRGDDFYSLQEYTISTNFEGIVASADGFYAMEVETRTGVEHIPVGKLKIDLTDKSVVLDALQSDLMPETKEAIYAAHHFALAGMIDPVATAFSPRLLESEFDVLHATPHSGGMRTYFTYRNTPMMSERFTITGWNTGTRNIGRGANAGQLREIAMWGAGFVPGLSFVASGISLIEAVTGGSNPGDAENWVNARLIYDSTMQFTFRLINNNWRHGFTSQMVIIRNIAYEAHFRVGTQRFNRTWGQTERIVAHVVRTLDYDFPWSRAFAGANSAVVPASSVQWGTQLGGVNAVFAFR